MVQTSEVVFTIEANILSTWFNFRLTSLGRWTMAAVTSYCHLLIHWAYLSDHIMAALC